MIIIRVYVENNPLTVPDGVTLYGISVTNVFVVAINPTQHIINVGHGCMIENITVTGAYGAGGVGFYYDLAGTSTRSMVARLQATNCETGFLVEMTTLNTAYPTLLAAEVFLLATATDTVQNGVVVQNGGIIRFSSCGFIGNPIHQIGKGLVVKGAGSEAYIQDSGFNYCTTAVDIDDDGILKFSGGAFFTNGDSIHVGSTATEGCSLDIIGTYVDESTSHDVNVQATKVKRMTMSGSRIKANKINNPNKVKLLTSFVNDHEENKTHTILGELNVGNHQFPSGSCFGGGSSHIIGLSVQSYDQGTTNYTDQTTSANSSGSSQFSPFVSIDVGNILYVGGDQEFPGIRVLMSTEAILGSGEFLSEYWDGSTWSEFMIMYSDAFSPYHPHAKKIFTEHSPLTEDKPYHVRFGKDMTAWTTTTVNSVSKYWVRFRIVSQITQIPVFEQIKLHANTTFINEDGYIEYFGSSRPIKRLPWDLNIAKPANSSPFNQDIYLSDNLNVGRTENGFISNQVDRTALNAFLPYEIDTSCPLRLIWSWYCRGNTGDVMWTVRWANSNDGALINESAGTAPSTFSSEQSKTLTETVPGTAYTQQTSIIEMDISNLIPVSHDSNTGELLWLSLERNGNDGADTAGDIILIQLAPFYFARAEGFHI